MPNNLLESLHRKKRLLEKRQGAGLPRGLNSYYNVRLACLFFPTGEDTKKTVLSYFWLPGCQKFSSRGSQSGSFHLGIPLLYSFSGGKKKEKSWLSFKRRTPTQRTSNIAVDIFSQVSEAENVVSTGWSDIQLKWRSFGGQSWLQISVESKRFVCSFTWTKAILYLLTHIKEKGVSAFQSCLSVHQRKEVAYGRGSRWCVCACSGGKGCREKGKMGENGRENSFFPHGEVKRWRESWPGACLCSQMAS